MSVSRCFIHRHRKMVAPPASDDEQQRAELGIAKEAPAEETVHGNKDNKLPPCNSTVKGKNYGGKKLGKVPRKAAQAAQPSFGVRAHNHRGKTTMRRKSPKGKVRFCQVCWNISSLVAHHRLHFNYPCHICISSQWSYHGD